MSSLSSAYLVCEPPKKFLEIAYEPSDWVAVFLKSYASGRVAQRVGPVPWVRSEQCQSWLLEMNARGFNVYVSVNGIAFGRRARTRDSIASIRHVFLEADRDGDVVLARVHARSDLPPPSYVLHSSPGRIPTVDRSPSSAWWAPLEKDDRGSYPRHPCVSTTQKSRSFSRS